MEPDRAYTVEEVARICHHANRGLQDVLDDSRVSAHWEVEAEAVKQSCIYGVLYALACDPTPEEHHAEWVAYWQQRDWARGPVKDEQQRTHPLLCSWAELEPGQRDKDRQFLALVNVYRGRVRLP